MHSICCMVVWFPQNSKKILTDGDEKKNRCNNRFILNMAKVSENLQQTHLRNVKETCLSSSLFVRAMCCRPTICIAQEKLYHI